MLPQKSDKFKLSFLLTLYCRSLCKALIST